MIIDHPLRRVYVSACTVRTALGLTVLIALLGCGDHDHAHAPHAEPEAAAAAPTNRIAIPAAVRSNLGITFAPATYRVVTRVFRIPGQFEAEANAKQFYHAPLAGQVEIVVQPYTAVTIGTPLYRIQGPEWLQLRARWHEAETLAKDPSSVGRRDWLRTTVAQAAGLPADDPVLLSLQNAPALTVHARAAGTVTATVVGTGTAVNADSEVLSTLDPTRIRFRATALHGDIGQWQAGASAAIVPITNSHQDRLPATFQLGLEADPRTRTVDVIARPTTTDRPAWARPGLAAVLEIVTAGGTEELAIPLAAVVRDGLTSVLFRRDPENPDQVIRMEADLGANDGVWVHVLSGLRADDTVVVGGIYPLLLSGAGAAAGSAGKAGHFHADGTFHEGGH